jgi:flagellar motor protein MotB
MAGAKGGGSWKVAYADFVTAMMAFFLVMWIGAQDQKTRQSVANYFIDPSGVSKKPVKDGAVLEQVTYGSVPHEQGTKMGPGRQAYNDLKQPGSATKAMADWIFDDQERRKKWRDQAQLCREAAAESPEVQENGKTLAVDRVAARELAKQLQVAFKADAPKLEGVHQDMMLWSLNEVNWTEIAEDLLRL